MNYLNMLAGAALGAIVAAGGFFAWNVVVDNPAVKAATLAKARENFNEAVGDLSNEADKAVALAVDCRARGGRWMPGGRECIEVGD